MKLSFLFLFFIGSILILFITRYWELNRIMPFLFTGHFFFIFLYFKSQIFVDSASKYIFPLILYFIIQSFIIQSSVLSLLQSILLPIFYFLFILLISSFRSVSLTILNKLSIVLLCVSPFFIISFETGGQGRLYGLFRNANLTAYTTSLLLPIILLHPKTKIKYLGIFISLCVLFFTQSRGATLSIILGLIVFFIVKKNVYRLNLFHYFLILSIVVLISVNIVHLFETYFADYVNDYKGESHLLYSGYNGREDLWDIFLERWKTSPLFGVGFENDKVFLNGTVYGVHNSYIDILMKSGLIGSFLVFLMFFKMLKNIISTKNKIFIPAIISSFAIVLSLSTNTSLVFVINYYLFYFLFLYSLINLKIVK